MSCPRYLNLILQKYSLEHFYVAKEIYIAGSLTRSEIERVIRSKYKLDVKNFITELTLDHYLIGVQSFTADDAQAAPKKRDQKAQVKSETLVKSSEEDAPIRLNFKRCLAEERK